MTFSYFRIKIYEYSEDAVREDGSWNNNKKALCSSKRFIRELQLTFLEIP